MATTAIRWLGAFGRSASLSDSFKWELETNRNGREVAAEWIDSNSNRLSEQEFTAIRGVGLLLAKGAIRRRFRGDVWSTRNGNRLVPTRRAWHSHTECFCKPEYEAIIITKPLGQLRAEIRRAVVEASQTYHLPVISLYGKVEYR